MPSNPDKSEEISEARFHSALDGGDIRRMLMAFLIIVAFALLEVGIFLFTLDEKPGETTSSPGEYDRPARNQLRAPMEDGPRSPRADKRERGYLETWPRLRAEAVSAQSPLTPLQGEEEVAGRQDSPGPQQAPSPGVDEPSYQ